MAIFPLTLRIWLREEPVQGAVAIYMAIVFAFLLSKDYTAVWISLAMPFLGLAAVTSGSRRVRFWAVLGSTGVLAALVAANYYVIANHGFLLTWCGLALAFALACEQGRDAIVLRRNAALLLGLLMAFAFVQKLRSPYYMVGDLLGGLIVQGDIAPNLIGWLLPDWPVLLQGYRASFAEMLARPEAGTVAIAVPTVVVAMAWRMTVASLLAQGALELLILFRARAGLFLHVAILGFVALVYTTRNENEFLSINCLLGFAMTDEKTATVRPWYVAAVILLLTADLLGLRPWLVG